MSKYSPEFVGLVRKWYLEDSRSDSEISALAAKLNPPVILSRNASIGLRARAQPPIVRPPFAAALRSIETGQKAAAIRWAADGARDRETRPAPPAKRPRPEPIRTPAPTPVQTPGVPPRERKAAPSARSGPTLLELVNGQCRNPVGPDATPDRPQMFCGAPVGTRTIEPRKGDVRIVTDVYCPGCANRNRQGLSSPAALVRSMRAFA